MIYKWNFVVLIIVRLSQSKNRSSLRLETLYLCLFRFLISDEKSIEKERSESLKEDLIEEFTARMEKNNEDIKKQTWEDF